MRVISGTLGGRTLHVPADAAFRPTTDRVKESVFNILARHVRWEDADVCDLFAGSGGLGIEALSRGARHCCFVESQRGSLRVLERNLGDLGLAGRSEIVRGAVESFLDERRPRKSDTLFGVVFADPPYRYPTVDRLLQGLHAVLHPDGIAVFEHEGRLRPEPPDTLEAVDRREYGTTAVTFLQHRQGAQP